MTGERELTKKAGDKKPSERKSLKEKTKSTGASKKDGSSIVAQTKAPHSSKQGSRTLSGGVMDLGVWELGGTFIVESLRLPLWEAPGADGTYEGEGLLGELQQGMLVTLLAMKASASGSPIWSQVWPKDGNRAGWVYMEDYETCSGKALERVHSHPGWLCGGRYAILCDCVLRKDKDLGSQQLWELKPGSEVLVLSLGVNEGDPSRKPRLRLKIATDGGTVGWLSPQTKSGYYLVSTLNLLSNEIIDLRHQEERSVGWNSALMESARYLFGNPTLRVQGGQRLHAGAMILPPGYEGQCNLTKLPSFAIRKSYDGIAVPWVAGGVYRILETARLKEQPRISGQAKIIARILAGALWSVERVEKDGAVPMAYGHTWTEASNAAGTDPHLRGWIRCVSKQGFDMLDIRDRRQLERVTKRLEEEEMEERRRNSVTSQKSKDSASPKKQLAAADQAPRWSMKKKLLPPPSNNNTEEDSLRAESPVSRSSLLPMRIQMPSMGDTGSRFSWLGGCFQGCSEGLLRLCRR